VRKIRRVKITIHHKEIARRLSRLKCDLKAAGLEGDLQVREFISGLAARLEAGTVFDSFDKEFTGFAGTGLPEKCFFTAAAATLGEQFSSHVTGQAEPNARAAAMVAGYEFLETAAELVCEIAAEEAAKENFNLGPYEIIRAPLLEQPQDIKVPLPVFIRESAAFPPETAETALPPLFERLNAPKIAVSTNNGVLSPAFTVVFIRKWQSRKKGR